MTPFQKPQTQKSALKAAIYGPAGSGKTFTALLVAEGLALHTGKRVACIGAGPASLTVANDLLPLGYEVTIFEQYAVPGGLTESRVPEPASRADSRP